MATLTMINPILTRIYRYYFNEDFNYYFKENFNCYFNENIFVNKTITLEHTTSFLLWG